MKLLSILAFFALSVTSFSQLATKPADITVSWDANVEPHLGGYRAHLGRTPRGYTQTFDVGNVVETPLKNHLVLTPGMWYSSVTAYGTPESGSLESEHSDELSLDVYRVVLEHSGNLIDWAVEDDYLTTRASATEESVPGKPSTIGVITGQRYYRYVYPDRPELVLDYELEDYLPPSDLPPPLSLTWHAPSERRKTFKFIIYKKTGEVWNQVGEVLAPKLSWPLTETGYYGVASVNNIGEGEKAEINITSLPTVPVPSPPQLFRIRTP
jgi:hypothetical protein